MEQTNFEILKDNEMQYRGHIEVLEHLAEDIDSIVSSYGKDKKQDLENALVNFIIQNR